MEIYLVEWDMIQRTSPLWDGMLRVEGTYLKQVGKEVAWGKARWLCHWGAGETPRKIARTQERMIVQVNNTSLGEIATCQR